MTMHVNIILLYKYVATRRGSTRFCPELCAAPASIIHLRSLNKLLVFNTAGLIRVFKLISANFQCRGSTLSRRYI